MFGGLKKAFGGNQQKEKLVDFKALIVERDEEGKTSAAVQMISDDRLPEADVLVAIEYSTLNYKDGLCLGSGGGLVKAYPHVPGIDFAGTVETSADPRFKEDDRVVLTGWRVGEIWWGGYAQKARVKGDWLTRLPDNMTTHTAMAIGTAGFTSWLAIDALQKHGLQKDNGPVLVTGASGGVGSVATHLLSRMGYEVAGVTGRPETAEYLKSLGASIIVPREELSETVRRPLEKEIWNGCIDAVGGAMLGRVLGQLKYGTSVAAIGLAGGADLPASVIPFLLRGVNLLGIDSVMQPAENRVRGWQELANHIDTALLESMIVPASLEDLPGLGRDILGGKVRGRVVVDVNAG